MSGGGGRRLEAQPWQTSGCQEGLQVSAQVRTFSTSVPALLYLLSPDSDSCGLTEYLNASVCTDTPSPEWLSASFSLCPPLVPSIPRVRGSPPLSLGATYIRIRAELDEKALPLEAQLPHLRPVEGIDLCEALKRKVSARESGNAQ